MRLIIAVFVAALALLGLSSCRKDVAPPEPKTFYYFVLSNTIYSCKGIEETHAHGVVNLLDCDPISEDGNVRGHMIRLQHATNYWEVQ
jgi:hypothetical protein